MQTDDFEVSPSHIRSLSNRDGVASFLLMLGYNVDRNVQSTASLGITAESLKRQITYIERIAVQDDWLHVYLFEMRSMRLADRQALARAFRNRSGDYLLVLTSDYDTLDFVLLQRVLPEGNGTPFARKQVTVRPRVLTVNRHNPSAVALRVLRRFSYTELDADYQFDKLLSAYAVAEWSEPLFNNRALFSDYYLTERLPDSEEGQQDPTSTYRALQKLMVTSGLAWRPKMRLPLRPSCLSRRSRGWASPGRNPHQVGTEKLPTTSSTLPMVAKTKDRWPYAWPTSGTATLTGATRPVTPIGPKTTRELAWSRCWSKAKRPT